jgi:hypothetical protein
MLVFAEFQSIQNLFQGFGAVKRVGLSLICLLVSWCNRVYRRFCTLYGGWILGGGDEVSYTRATTWA